MGCTAHCKHQVSTRRLLSEELSNLRMLHEEKKTKKMQLQINFSGSKQVIPLKKA